MLPIESVDFSSRRSPLGVEPEPIPRGLFEQDWLDLLNAACRLLHRAAPIPLHRLREFLVAGVGRLANALPHELKFVPVFSASLKDGHFKSPFFCSNPRRQKAPDAQGTIVLGLSNEL